MLKLFLALAVAACICVTSSFGAASSACASKEIDMVGKDAKIQSVISRIFSRTPEDLVSLELGLYEEMEDDALFQNTWNNATDIYNKMVADGKLIDPAPRVYHIALLTYTLKAFFGTFNWETYSINDLAGADKYPYPYYLKVLDQAIQKVQGKPSKSTFNGNTVLYRGMGGKALAVAGDDFSFQQMSSFTLDREIAEKYASESNKSCQTIFVVTGPIKNRLGLQNHSVAESVADEEVLLPPEQRYTVTSVEENGGQTIISLKAV